MDFTHDNRAVTESDQATGTTGRRKRNRPGAMDAIQQDVSVSAALIDQKKQCEIAFIGDVLDSIFSAYRAIAAGHGIQFEVVGTPDDLPGVLVQPEALQEAITNLLDNAFKYVVLPKRNVHSPSANNHSPRVRVQLLSNTDANMPGVTILIEDNGPGIPVSEREAVFQRGMRGQVSQRVDGTGIGLAIARSLVTMCGGSLRVASQQEYVGALDGAILEVVLYRNPENVDSC